MPTISGKVYDAAGVAAPGRVVRAYRRDTGAFIGEAVTADGSASSADPHYASVSVLLHLDGADGSTTFTDSSPNPKTFTGADTVPTISTAQSKFGGASASFGGGKIAAAYDPSFNLNGVSWTIEFFAYRTSASNGTFITRRTSNISPYEFRFDSSGSVQALLSNAATDNWDVVFFTWSGVTAALNTWCHVAICGAGGVIRVFIDGVEASNQLAGAILGSSTGGLYVGKGPDNSFYGYIDEFRLTNGVARYTANFTPPSAPFPVSATALAAGAYTVASLYTGEVQVVCLDDSAGTTYNDLILRTTPV